MTDHEFIVAVSLFSSVLGLIAVGYLFRSYQLDAFREQVFALREEVFLYAIDHRLIDSQAYRGFRALLNGTLRYAHKATFPHMVLLAVMKRVFKLPADRENDPMKAWVKALDDLCPEQKAEFLRFNNAAATLFVKRIAFSSVLFWVFAISVALPLVISDRLLTNGQPGMAWTKLKGAIRTRMPLDLLEAEALKADYAFSGPAKFT